MKNIRVFHCEADRFSEAGRLAVGGQTAYPHGPSVLLTVYDNDRAVIEVQLPDAECRELCRLLEDRRQSWLEREDAAAGVG